MKENKGFLCIVFLNLFLSLLTVYLSPRFDIITFICFVTANAIIFGLLVLDGKHKENRIKKKIEDIFSLLHSLDTNMDNYEVADDEFGGLRDEIIKVIGEKKVIIDKAVKSEQILREYTEDIAHQLKTPLTGILLMLDLMEEDEENKKKKYNIDVRVEYSFWKFLKKIIIGEEIDITYNSYLFNNNKYKNAITNLEEIDKIYEIAFADKKKFNNFTNKEKALFEYIAKEIIKSPYKNLKIDIINFLKFEENTNEEYKAKVKAIQNLVFKAFKIEMNLFTDEYIFFIPVTAVFSKISELYSKKEFFIRLNFSYEFLEYFSKKDYFLKSNSILDYYLSHYDDKLENKRTI